MSTLHRANRRFPHRRIWWVVAVLFAFAILAGTGGPRPAAAEPARSASVVAGGGTALVITVQLQATPDTPKPALDATPGQVIHDVIDSTRPWFQHASHGRFSGYFALGRGAVTVQPTQPTCQAAWLDEIADKADAAIQRREPALNPGQFDVVIYYFGRVGCSANEAGWGIPGRVWLNGDRTTRTAVHELGHHLGLDHANSEQCLSPSRDVVPLSSTCTRVEYGDVFSAMGSAGELGDGYAPHQLTALGWIEGRTAISTSSVGTATYALAPVEDDPPSGVVQYLKVIDGANVFWLNFHRKAAPRVSSLASYTSGLLVRHEVNPQASSGHLLHMNRSESLGLQTLYHPNMVVGQTWTNPLGTVSVTLNAAEPTGATVTIAWPVQPPPPVRVVPDLLDENHLKARDAIRSAGLVVGTVKTRVDEFCEELGTVVQQTPARGTTAPAASRVDFTYTIRPAGPCRAPR